MCLRLCISVLDDDGLNYYIGIETNKAFGDTENTEQFYINSGLYAMFQTPKASHADFVNTIQRTWKYAFDEWLPSSEYKHTGGYSFETYTEQSTTFSEKIYIPIQKTT